MYHTRQARLYELDLTGSKPGDPVEPRVVLELAEPRAGLNGACLLALNVLLAAGVADLIWRTDLREDGDASARI